MENGHQAPTEDTLPRVYYRGEEANGERYGKAKENAEQKQGNLFREKAHWQAIAVGLLLGQLVSWGLIFYLGRQPAFEPKYVVQNSEGQFQVLGWDEYHPETQEIKRDLLWWMRCVREIPNDGPALQRCWRRIPLFLFEKSQAMAQVVKYRALVKPKESLYRRSVIITDGSLQAWQEPDGRWRMQWTEEVYELPRTGGVGRLTEGPTRRSAILLVTRQKPTKKAQLELDGEPVNPLGLYITQLAWSD